MDSRDSFFTRKNIFLLLGGLLLGMLLGVVILWSDGFFAAQKSKPPVVGEPMPSFTLFDTNGKEISLIDYLGTPVVINTWASWCKPCENEMPLLNRASADLDGKVVFLGINMGEDKASVMQFGKDLGLQFTLLLDPKETIADRFAISGYPTTYFVDAVGTLQAIRMGELSPEMLDAYLKMIGVNR